MKTISADWKDYLECPACGQEVDKSDRGREEMKAHKAECHGYESAKNRFDIGDRVEFSDFGKIRLRHKRKLDRIGSVVGFSRDWDNLVRVHWDGTSENTVYRFEHSFLKQSTKGGTQ